MIDIKFCYLFLTSFISIALRLDGMAIWEVLLIFLTIGLLTELVGWSYPRELLNNYTIGQKQRYSTHRMYKKCWADELILSSLFILITSLVSMLLIDLVRQVI